MLFKKKAAIAKDLSSASSGPVGTDAIRFGIKVKLQVAFGVAAVMTLIAAAVAMMSFSATERGFQRVAGHEVPVMTDTLRLSVISGEISTAAARFVSANTADDQRAISTVIAARSGDLGRVLAQVRKARGSDAAFAAVEDTAKKLQANLDALKKAISERTELRAKLEGKLADLHKVHTEISGKLTPLVDDSYFDVVAAAGSVGQTGDRTMRSMVDHDLPMLQATVEIGSEINLVTGLLTASTLASSPSLMGMLEDRYTASAHRAQKLLAKLPSDDKFTQLKSQIADLLSLADFKTQPGSESDKSPERLNKIFRAQESLTELLVKLADDLNFNLVMKGENAANITNKVTKELVAKQIYGLRNALETVAQVHLLTSLISEGAVTGEAASIVPIQDRFKASSDLLTKSTAALADKKIRAVIDELIKFGNGPAGVFALHKQELQANAVAAEMVKENAELQRALNNAVNVVVAKSEASVSDSSARLMSDLNRNRDALLIVAVVSLLIAAGIGVFYVQRNVVRRLTSIGETMHRLSAGEMDLTVPAVDDRDEIGRMARSVLVFRDAAIGKVRLERETEEQRRASEEERRRAGESVEAERRTAAEAQARTAQEQAQIISRLAEGLSALSNGDFSFRLAEGFTGAAAKIKDDFNSMADQIAQTIAQVKAAAREITSAAVEISTSTTDLSQSAEEQAASLEQTSASMEEISNTVKKTAENAQRANQFAGTTRDVANRGGEVVARAVNAMALIQEASGEIANIIGVIDEIARQTNLLALNAAVEAARAGEAGRGFAVVASEVRSLAQRSAEAAKGINDLITNSHGKVKEGVELVNRTGASLTEIVESIRNVANIVSEIANASSEQSNGLEQINKALTQLDELTQRNSALAEENTASAKTLESQSIAMNEQVAFFRIDEGSVPAAAGHKSPTPDVAIASGF
jgi:methyl-accepting chemotaxis protein